ncbi:hypothetical protein, partial [Natronomonas sp.]|uniref:hypothetical protein n=1 Tax=Natronomonas sp. TaxID=2184060 RepID=UPI0039768BE9
LERVAGSFNEAIDGLQRIIGDVEVFTDEVVTASEASTERIDGAVENGEGINGAQALTKFRVPLTLISMASL